jgi:hypothetical protein
MLFCLKKYTCLLDFSWYLSKAVKDIQQNPHVDTEVFAPLHKGQHGRQTQALMLPSAAGMHVA